MSVTTEQFKEMAERTEKARQKPIQPVVTPVEKDIINSLNEHKKADLVVDFWASEGVPRPVTEFIFFAGRKWRFDFCWPSKHLALECNGGVFVQGRHTRGAALLKEWEKLNTAAIYGYRILFCQPPDLLTVKLTQTIKQALKI